jgi:heme exporter protein CcmD
MSLHWLHVAAAWALTLLLFGGMALAAALRHRAAKRRLAQLEQRR